MGIWIYRIRTADRFLYKFMQLPNGERAIVDEAKLRDYCLNEAHARGKHKARLFRTRLGITVLQVELLRNAILRAAKTEDANPGDSDQYGDRFSVDFEMTGPSGRARVRSAWIILAGEAFPRLAGCYDL